MIAESKQDIRIFLDAMLTRAAHIITMVERARALLDSTHAPHAVLHTLAQLAEYNADIKWLNDQAAHAAKHAHAPNDKPNP